MVPPLMWMSYAATCFAPCSAPKRNSRERYQSVVVAHTAVASVASWLSPKARKGQPSTIEGRGLFAVAPIATGEVVAVKGGHIVDTATVHALPERLQETDI